MALGLDENGRLVHSRRTTAELIDQLRESDAERYAEEERAAIGEERGSGVQPAAFPFPVFGASALSEELPPVPWLVERLRLTPGAPTMIAGYGFSGKTMAVQDLALSVATGRDVWGLFRAQKGRVLHIDYEQGRRLSQERYQRLARGRGFELAELENDALRLAVVPTFYFDQKQAEDLLMRACEGLSLIIVDSLRAACPSVDENSSEVRRPLDMLMRVSERTGAVVLVLHHANKPQKDGPSGAKYSIRGSGALFDACASSFVFEGKKGEPVTVHHEKDRVTGVPMESFGLAIADVLGPSGPKWGVRVTHLEAEQLARKPKNDLEALRVTLRGVMRDNPGAGLRRLRILVGGRKDHIDELLEEMVDAGAATMVVGSRGSHQFYLGGEGGVRVQNAP